MDNEDICDWLKEDKRWAVLRRESNNRSYSIIAVTTTYEQAEDLANFSKNYYVHQIDKYK